MGKIPSKMVWCMLFVGVSSFLLLQWMGFVVYVVQGGVGEGSARMPVYSLL